VNKKAVFILSYVLFCVGLMLFIFVSLGIYEENFSNVSGAWYSKKSMELYQYAAYLLTYIISFPIGTILCFFDSGYISEKWFVVCVPNFIIYYYLVIKIKTMLASIGSSDIKEPSISRDQDRTDN
jgi:hypothetical protein